MIRSGAKLLFLACVPLGGFLAGVMYHHFVKQGEIYAFFLAAGCGLSLVGCFGFANLGARGGRTPRPRARPGAVHPRPGGLTDAGLLLAPH
jgi:hypothetical protein